MTTANGMTVLVACAGSDFDRQGTNHLCIEVGNEQPCGLIHSVWRPMLRVCQVQYLLPVLQVGDDLEGFGHFASCETAHDLAHCLVHFHHLGV